MAEKSGEEGQRGVLCGHGKGLEIFLLPIGNVWKHWMCLIWWLDKSNIFQLFTSADGSPPEHSLSTILEKRFSLERPHLNTLFSSHLGKIQGLPLRWRSW